MSSQISTLPNQAWGPVMVGLDDMPVMYEDDGEPDMGESNPHSTTEHIFRYGVAAHLASLVQYQVFSNLNLYYHAKARSIYVSPDDMIVTPFSPLPYDLKSYRIGMHGPAPIVVVEVLSERSAQEHDLDDKVSIYGDLRVPEYILIDVTGAFLPQKLLIKKLQRDGSWQDEQDPDGGITSRLGFRLIIDSDARLRVTDRQIGAPICAPR